MSNFLEKLNTILEVMKYLHEPDSRKNCAEKFKIHERTIRNYDNEDDVVIGNVVIPFKLIETHNGEFLSNSEYLNEPIDESDLEKRSSVHPVILPLNLSEVYLLTAGILKNLGRNHPKYDEYWHIANKIYSQLSDYGKRTISWTGIEFEELDKVTYTKETAVEGRNSNMNSALRTVTEEELENMITTASKGMRRVGLLLDNDEYVYGKFKYISSMLYFETDYGETYSREDLNIKNMYFA